ncbi:hypothetical protein [Senegalimassilia anaerobia]
MVSLAAIVLIQGALPISVLAFSGVKGTLEGNAISIDARAVDNRKVNLESAMVKSWAGISRETVSLNSALSDQLAQSGLDVPGFLADGSQKEAFVADAFPRLLSVIGSNTTSGVYLILGNDGDLSVEQDHIGAFLRDSDPTGNSDSHSDLLLERGDKEIAATRPSPLTTPGRRSCTLPAAACAAPTTSSTSPTRPPCKTRAPMRRPWRIGRSRSCWRAIRTTATE